jgi:DNA-binding GntR family transcriptional regulator
MSSLTPPTPSPRPRSAGKHIVVRGLLAGLLKGEWVGGARLTEAEAVEKFGVSRTPVREALLELQGLGLIELRRNCGAVFLPFGPDQLREIYDVRSLLEVEAARLAAGRVDADTLQSLFTAFTAIRESGGIDPDWNHDRTLHRTIAAASGNHRLSSEISRYGEVIQSVREIVGEQSYGIHETTADEHLAILEAVRHGDADAAAAAMKAHLSQASDSAARAADLMRSLGSEEQVES